jgi:peptide/nickel transport system substrate-binding protein
MSRAALALIGLSLLFTACSPTASSRDTASQPSVPSAPGRTLVAALRVEPNSVAAKPIGAGGVATYLAKRLFNADFAQLDDDGVAQPYLAEALPRLNTASWQVFPDGRMETTYRLKPSLVWHNGAALTADDWVFSHKLYATPELAASAGPVGLIDEVLAPDPRTVVIRWKRPFVGAGAIDSSGTGAPANFPPLPRATLEAAFETGSTDAVLNHPYWTREFIGLGPYRLQRWEPGSFLEATAFEQHVFGAPKIDRIKLQVMPDNNATIAGLLAGEVHLAPSDSNFPLGQVKNTLRQMGEGGAVLLHPNQWRRADIQLRSEFASHPGLLDVRVRKALAYAMDKDPINEAVYDGQSIPADVMIPTSSAAGRAVDAAITKYPFDLRKSQEMMSAAGYVKGTDGFYTSPTQGRFVSELKTNAGTDNVAEMTILADGYRQAGFDIKDAVLPVALSQDAEARATFPGLFSANGNVEGAIAFKSILAPNSPNRYSIESRGGWNHAEYARLLDTFSTALDANERTRLLVGMTKIFTDDLPVISMFFNCQPWVYTAALQGPRLVASETNLSWRIYEWTFK